MDALDASVQTENTTVVYTSDHGDNVGERGLWGKPNLYQESVHIPMIMAGPDVPVCECRTPVSLFDFATAATLNATAALFGYFGAAFLIDNHSVGRLRLQVGGFFITGNRNILYCHYTITNHH